MDFIASNVLRAALCSELSAVRLRSGSWKSGVLFPKWFATTLLLGVLKPKLWTSGDARFSGQQVSRFYLRSVNSRAHSITDSAVGDLIVTGTLRMIQNAMTFKRLVTRCGTLHKERCRFDSGCVQ